MIGTTAPELTRDREIALVEEGKVRGRSGANLGSFAEVEAWDGELATYPRKAARAYLDGFHAGRVEWLRAQRQGGQKRQFCARCLKTTTDYVTTTIEAPVEDTARLTVYNGPRHFHVCRACQEKEAAK